VTLTVLCNDHIDTDPEEVLSNKIYFQVCFTLSEKKKKDSMAFCILTWKQKKK